MRTHVITVRLEIQAQDELTNAELLADLQRQLGEMQEPSPWRRGDDAMWWIGHKRSSVGVSYENMGDQLLAEKQGHRWPPEACPNCGGVGSGCHCD